MTQFSCPRLAVTALASAALLGACTPSHSKPVPMHSKPAAQKSAPKKPQASDLTQNLGLSGQATQISVADPHHQNWTMYRLSVASVIGNIAGNEIDGRGLTATIFQRNRPVQQITARSGRANTQNETIYASGNVTVDYLTRPGSSLRADSVKWNAKTRQGVAWGHVHFRYVQAKNITTGTAPILYFNTDGGVISSTPLSGGQ